MQNSSNRALQTRKPLSDCTNKLPQSRNNNSSSQSSSNSSIPTKTIFDFIKASTNKRPSNFTLRSTNDDQNRLSTPSRRPRPPHNLDGVSGVFEPQKVYNLRRSVEKRSKGKEVAKCLSDRGAKKRSKEKEVAQPLSSSSPSLLANNPTKKSSGSDDFTKNHATAFDGVDVGSSNNENNNDDGYNQNPVFVDHTQLLTPLRMPPQSDVDNEVFEPQTVYTRRRSSEKRSKEKEVAEPISSSSGKRIRNAGEQKDADGSACPSKRQRVLRGKKTKDASKDSLDTYIKEQRAYFEAIDAEKLEEESD